MSEEILVSKLVVTTIKCGKCHQYLSVLPIKFDPSTGSYQCGRCTTDSKNLVEALAYQNLAKLLLFPCKYDLYGCTQHFRIHETKNHENECEFQTITCPAICCEMEVAKLDVFKHFQRFHKELIINSNIFSISHTKNMLVNKLMQLEDDIYVLELCVNVESHNFSLGLRNLLPNPQSKEKIYQLEVRPNKKNTTTFVLSQQRVTEYFPEYNHKDLISFDYEMLKSILKSESYLFEIKFLSNINQPLSINNDPTKNVHLLKELECVICKEYMLSPIYICKIGHSICSECKINIKKCPTCQSEYEGARNFALEKLSELVSIPCKNQSNGCCFVGSSHNIRNHENECTVRIIKCPLGVQESCKWKGLLHEVYTHSKEKHPHRSWLKLNLIMHRNLKSTHTLDCYIVKYYGNIFKVCMKHDNHKMSLSFAVEHVDLSSNEKPKYQFIVNFADQTKTGRILTVNELCYSLSDQHPDLFSKGITLPHGLLKPFIKNDSKVMFSIDVKLIVNKFGSLNLNELKNHYN